MKLVRCNEYFQHYGYWWPGALGGYGGSLLRSFLVSGILLVQRHTTQNQFSAFGLRYEHYIRCYWQVCSTGSSPVPLLRTALTLFVPTSRDGCIRQILDSKVVVRVKRWPTRKKSLLILLSWLVKQRSSHRSDITRPCVSSRLWVNSRKSHCGDYDHFISTIGFPIRVGVNSDSAIPIPIPAKLKFTIPWLAIPIPILQLQFLFFFFNLIWKSSATMNYCRFKIKMPSYQHRNSHYKGVMVLWLSYVYNVHPYVYNVDPYTSYLEKQSLYVLNTFFVGISFVFVIIWMRFCGLKW